MAQNTGMYVFSTVASTPKYSFRGAKEPLKRKDVPGPGAYTQDMSPIANKSPNYAFSKSARDRRIRGNPVGPGQYETVGDMAKKARSNRGTISQAARNVHRGMGGVPGPGSYNVPSTFSPIGTQFSHSVRDTSYRRSVPGPGAYTVEGTFPTKIKEPQFSFAKTARGKKVKNWAPGPGAYDHESKIESAKSPAYTIRGRFMPKSRVQTDGGNGRVYSQFG